MVLTLPVLGQPKGQEELPGGVACLSPSVQNHPHATGQGQEHVPAPVSPRTCLVPLPGAQGAARTRLRKALRRGRDSPAIALGGLQLSQSRSREILIAV